MAMTFISNFKIDDDVYNQFLNLDNDSVYIFKDTEYTGLEFDYSGCCKYQEKTIGRIRFPIKGELDNMFFVLKQSNKDEIKIDTGISAKDVECYLKAEVVITKLLIERMLISLS